MQAEAALNEPRRVAELDDHRGADARAGDEQWKPIHGQLDLVTVPVEDEGRRHCHEHEADAVRDEEGDQQHTNDWARSP